MTRRKRIFLGVVGICLNQNKEVLLTQRNDPKNPYIHHKWQLPGGGIEFGESTEETAKRELEEELGCRVKILQLIPYIGSHVYKELSSPIQIIAISYLAQIVSGTPNTKHYETAALKWIKPSQINFSECLPLTKEILVEAKLLKN